MSRAADMARGHWGELLPVLGVDSRFLVNQHGPCPICGGKDRFRWDDQNGGGGYFCSGCGAGDGFDLVIKTTGKTFKQVADQIAEHLGKDNSYQPKQAWGDDAKNKDAMQRVWQRAKQPTLDGPVSLYLLNRTGSLWPSVSIREAILPQDSKLYPVMVSKVIGPNDRAVNLHLTFLTEDGRKAAVQKPKKVMPGKLPDGCSIRLAKAAPVMGVAEGIETAISAAMMFDMPVWACVNGGLLAKWMPPEIAQEITIFGDNDASYTGQAKAYQLANRLEVQYKRKVNVILPPTVGTDWADVWQEKRDNLTSSPNFLRVVK